MSKKHFVLATFFDSMESAVECAEKRRKEWKKKMVIVEIDTGFLVISEQAMKNVLKKKPSAKQRGGEEAGGA